MGALDRITGVFSRGLSRKSNPAMRAILAVGPFRAKWMSADYETFSREGYGSNPYVYAAIRQISMAFAGLKWRAWTDETKKREYLKHPILTLIRRPNSGQGQSRFFENFVGYLGIDGNSYILRTPNEDVAPDELYTLRPDRVKIIPGTVTNPVLAYTYTVSGVTVSFPPEVILHQKYFNPIDDWYGMSPLQAARFSVDQSNQSKAWNVAMLQNGARPSGALSTELNVDDMQYQRLREMIDEQHASWNNAGRPLILEGGLKWEEMGLTPDEMSWVEGQKLSAREVAMTYNIAPELIGDPESKTFSNYGEAREALYEENILPFASWVRDDLNMWLSPLYKDGVYLDYDRDFIEALQEDRTKIYMRNDASIKAGWITIGMAQKAAGLEVDPVYGSFYRWQLPNFAPADPIAPPPPWAQAKAPATNTPSGPAADGSPNDSPIGHNTPPLPSTPGTPGKTGGGRKEITLEDLKTFVELSNEAAANGRGNHNGHKD